MLLMTAHVSTMEFLHIKVLFTTAGTLLLLSIKWCSGQDIIRQEYRIEEETGVGVLVGNAGRDSGLYSKHRMDIHLLMFQPFAQGNEFISYFTVEAPSGIIRTAKNIDRETVCPDLPVCSVKLSIAVYRRSPNSESPYLLNILEIVVIINDINDNRPTFPSRVVNLPVPENLDVNYQVESSVAMDADEEGDNSRITYRLVPPSEVFELSTVRTTDGVEDLVITIKRVLDREEKSLYPLMVVATDLGEQPRSGSVLINIRVTDMNDNAPVFARLNYSVNILENSDITAPVVVVKASDRDEGENSRLTYSLSVQVSQDVRDTFTVDPNSGKIFSRKQLDHETKQLYQFQVVVSDNGSPSRSNFAYVTINVIDVNDNVPQIQVNPAPAGDTVLEHGSVGKFLAYIKVSDADSREYGQVSCHIEDPHFLLELVDGLSLGIYKIILKQTLDREVSPTRDVIITCQDGSARPMLASTSFIVTIEDINDNSPVFVEASLFGSILENGDVDAYVMQVMANDPDEGENSRVTFALTSGNEISLFTIDEITGVISTNDMLDREVKGQYLLEVTATDHGVYALMSTSTVTIKVLDENDNPPKFKKQAFSSSIMENLPAGSPAGSISAYDLDSKENAKFVFSIIDEGMGSGDGVFFNIDSNTGLLTSGISFNREERSIYKFLVKVADPNIGSFYDIANLTLIIQDDNDHAPFVVKPPPSNRTFRCPFNMTVGEVITTFVAVDDDDPNLVDITYQIQDTNPNSKKWPLFSIEPASGKVKLVRQIRPDDVGTYTLDVIVKDGPGIASKTTIVSVSINVEEGSEEAMRVFSEGSKSHIVLVIIIIAATLVLAFIIIIIICLIRCADKKRHPQLPPASSDVNSKMYHAAKWVSSVSETKDIGPEEIRSILELPGEKKRKKEVSFSLNGNAVGSPASSDSPVHIFAATSNISRRTDRLPFQMNTLEGDFIVINGMTTPDYSHHLYEATTKDEHQFMEVRQADDRYSDASSGDTGNSDSGRGGSEDEGNGHINTSGDAERRKFLTDPLSRGARTSRSSRMGYDSNSLKHAKEQQSSTKDAEDVPGSPTPLLSSMDRQTSAYCYIRRSLDHLPPEGHESPASACSSPSSSLTKQTPYYRKQRHYNSELLMRSNTDSDGPYRVKNAEQHYQLLKTFSSPHASDDPRGISRQTWRRVPGLDNSSRSTSAKQKGKQTTTGSYTIHPGALKKDHAHDVLV